jgi:hypothetical protein
MWAAAVAGAAARGDALRRKAGDGRAAARRTGRLAAAPIHTPPQPCPTARSCAAPDFSGALLLPAEGGGGQLRGDTAAAAAAAAPARAWGAPYFYANVTYSVPPDQADTMCSGRMADAVAWLAPGGTSAPPFAAGGAPGGGRACPAGSSGSPAGGGLFCALYGNPNLGMTSFDNILWAWVAIFQVVTMVGWFHRSPGRCLPPGPPSQALARPAALAPAHHLYCSLNARSHDPAARHLAAARNPQEGWTDILYATQAAVSVWSWAYFVPLVMFGSYFLVNLALAVLYLQFIKEPAAAPGRSSTDGAGGTGAASGAAAGRSSVTLRGGSVTLRGGSVTLRGGAGKAGGADSARSPRVAWQEPGMGGGGSSVGGCGGGGSSSMQEAPCPWARAAEQQAAGDEDTDGLPQAQVVMRRTVMGASAPRGSGARVGCKRRAEVSQGSDCKPGPLGADPSLLATPTWCTPHPQRLKRRQRQPPRTRTRQLSFPTPPARQGSLRPQRRRPPAGCAAPRRRWRAHGTACS